MKRKIALGVVAAAVAGTWVLYPATDVVMRTKQIAYTPCCDRQICCPPFFDRPVSDDKILCSVDEYVGHYAMTQDQCPEGIWHVRMNKIRGIIGDSNGDAEVDFLDFIDFVACLESTNPDPIECFCPFDYDCDSDVDVRDFAGFQIAFGTGNRSWQAGQDD